jgi:hypothetical protein
MDTYENYQKQSESERIKMIIDVNLCSTSYLHLSLNLEPEGDMHSTM